MADVLSAQRESRSEHRTELATSFLDDHWTATCSCGWIGERRDSISTATRDSHSHREENRDA